MSLKGESVKQCRLIDLPGTHHRFKSPPQGQMNQRSPSASTVEFFNTIGAKRSLKIAGEARVAHELLTDNLFDLAGAQRG
jgi:hypothetical protein